MNKSKMIKLFSIRSLVAGIFIFVTIPFCRSEETVERRIIVSDKAPAPLAYYSQAVQVGSTLYISGNLGMTKDGDLVEGVSNQTKLALDNIGYILEAAGITFNHVIKVSVMLTNIQDYGAMNDIYGQYFNEKAPARSAYAVANLPRDALVEIDAVAVVGEIVDVDEKKNAASRPVDGLLSVLMPVLSLATFRVLTSWLYVEY